MGRNQVPDIRQSRQAVVKVHNVDWDGVQVGILGGKNQDHGDAYL